jgi:hypothetical protein
LGSWRNPLLADVVIQFTRKEANGMSNKLFALKVGLALLRVVGVMTWLWVFALVIML